MAGARRARWRPVWRVARTILSLGLVAVAAFVLLGRKGELSGAGSSLSHIEGVWVVLAVAAEALSMTCFSLLTGRLIAEARYPLRLRSLLGIALAGNAVTNSLPAGPAFGAAYAFRRYRERGVPDFVSGWAVLASTLLATMGLALLAAVGVAAALGQGQAFDLVGAVTGTLVATVLLMGVLRRPQVVAPPAHLALSVLRRLARRPHLDTEGMVEEWQRRLRVVTPSWPGLWTALGWAVGNWMLDLACLVCAFGAVDAPVPWRALLLAYGAAQLAANLPITPGGLGVVEGSLTIGLVAYGGSQTASVAAVLVYRMVSFWGLVALGWAVAAGLALIRRRAAAAADPAVGPVPAPVPAPVPVDVQVRIGPDDGDGMVHQ